MLYQMHAFVQQRIKVISVFHRDNIPDRVILYYALDISSEKIASFSYAQVNVSKIERVIQVNELFTHSTPPYTVSRSVTP